MNYIILSDRVSRIVEERYNRIVSEYGYIGNIDSYLENLFSFNSQYKLALQYSDKQEYQLIGKNCCLFMEQQRRHSDWFYAKYILDFDNEKEYNSKLSEAVELPGTWKVVLYKESFGLQDYDTVSISTLLSKVKPGYKELKEFSNNLRMWDLYNSKLKEYELNKEKESEVHIQKVVLENNIFTLRLERLLMCYKLGAAVCIITEENKRLIYLGTISEVRADKSEIDIICEDMSFILQYNESKIGRFIKIRITDFGTKARLNRQSRAMERLFMNNAANRHLKDILLGEYLWDEPENNIVTLDDTTEMFGSNIRQKEAFTGAVNAPDIYMIQGPPGTGKTTIITELVKYIINSGQNVLISSETNIAVDNVLERISYTGSVIPVRLGNADRVDKYCHKYMPEQAAQTILNNAKQKNMFLDKNGINEKILLKSCEDEWKEKECALENEIKRLEDKLDINVDYDELLGKIERFEKLICEMNEQYNSIDICKNSYQAEKERLEQLKIKKADIDEQLILYGDTIMSSGLNKKKDTYIEEGILRKQQEEINIEIDRIIKSLSDNRYEVIMASYRRKIKRFERNRSQLCEILNEDESIVSKAHQIRQTLENINILKKQLEKIKNNKHNDMEYIRKDCIRKKELWEKSRGIRDKWNEVILSQNVKKDVEELYMKSANALFATCTGIASSENGSFAKKDYDYVIIDEAAKCNVLDLLIPLNMGRKIILVGDHKQLYPMLEINNIKDEMSKDQIKELKEHILFKWLYEENVPKRYKIMLNRQYRMEKNISQFVSDNFYNGELICEKNRKNDDSMIWIDSDKSQEIICGTSYINPFEADIIVALLNKLDNKYNDNENTSVGVICAYKSQAEYINEKLLNKTFNHINVECNTIDAFQGKEKHTVIFNIVRSVRLGEFIKDENRVNVAVSRAKDYLYIVGKASLVKNDKECVLKKLYDYVGEKGRLYNSLYVR